jgi:hypothetical protein
VAPTAARPEAPALPARPALRPASGPAPEAAKPAPVKPAAPRPGLPKAGGAGWLSDLLNRASQEEQAATGEATDPGKATQAGSLGAIDTITGNIARMIDHPAAVELWERYHRGETGVFSRRIYTAQGQQTFDEIRRRYQAEPEFRRTVDRYVREFERLLGDVSRADKDPKRANAYLTSETGKVYTMLAHASGRFEGA